MKDKNLPDGKIPKYAGIIIGLLALLLGVVQFLSPNDAIPKDSIISEQMVADNSDYPDDSGFTQDTQTMEVVEEDVEVTEEDAEYIEFVFRNEGLLNSHYEKHGKDMGFENAADYEKAASDVVNNKSALHKVETEDGDDVYYVENTNEFVVVSTDGYIRTYFEPNDGIEYFNRQ